MNTPSNSYFEKSSLTNFPSQNVFNEHLLLALWISQIAIFGMPLLWFLIGIFVEPMVILIFLTPQMLTLLFILILIAFTTLHEYRHFKAATLSLRAYTLAECMKMCAAPMPWVLAVVLPRARAPPAMAWLVLLVLQLPFLAGFAYAMVRWKSSGSTNVEYGRGSEEAGMLLREGNPPEDRE